MAKTAFPSSVGLFVVAAAIGLTTILTGCARPEQAVARAPKAPTAKSVSALTHPVVARLQLGGEPWDTTRSSVHVRASTSDAPAVGEWDPWGTTSGSRILTVEVTRDDDHRTFYVQVPLDRKAEPRGVKAIASYRTTRGDLWTAQDEASTIQITAIEKDDNGEVSRLSATFDLRLGKAGEARPLHVVGTLEDIPVVEASDDAVATSRD